MHIDAAVNNVYLSFYVSGILFIYQVVRINVDPTSSASDLEFLVRLRLPSFPYLLQLQVLDFRALNTLVRMYVLSAKQSRTNGRIIETSILHLR